MENRRLRTINAAIPRLVQLLKAGRLNRREFLRTATLLGLSLQTSLKIAATMIDAVIAQSTKAATPNKGGVVSFGMRVPELDDVTSLNRVEQTNIVRQVNEHLVRIGQDNIARPWLLKSWEVSDDLKIWKLHLREGLRWNNGDNFFATHVKFNIKRWGERGSGLLRRIGAPDVYSVRVLDDFSLRVELSKPDLLLPERLAHHEAIIFHPKYFEHWIKTPVGTGPFILDRYEPGVRARLRANRGYWGLGPFLDTLTFIDLSNEPGAWLAALTTGMIQGLMEIPIEQVEMATSISRVRLHERVTSRTAVARMRVDTSPFDDVRVRTAVRICQDHDLLRKIAHRGYGAPAEDHHVAPIQPDYVALPRPRQDYERARRLLWQAGYPDGIKIELNCRSSSRWELSLAEALAEMCQPAGIRISIKVLPSYVFWQTWKQTPFGLTPWLINQPAGLMTLNSAYRSDASWNESRYHNLEFDRTLDLASSTVDVHERQRLMRKLLMMLQNDAVIAQPFWLSVFTATDHRLKGFELHPGLYLYGEEWWIE